MVGTPVQKVACSSHVRISEFFFAVIIFFANQTEDFPRLNAGALCILYTYVAENLSKQLNLEICFWQI